MYNLYKQVIRLKDDNVNIRQATKEGIISIKTFPAVVDLSFPASKTRRDRVQFGGKFAPTLCCSGEVYIIEEV